MAQQWQKHEFVTIGLTKKDVNDLIKYAESEENVMEVALTKIVSKGYKVSCNFSVDKGAFVVSVIAPHDHKDNPGLILTSWSDNLAEAVFMCGYKVFEICNGKGWKIHETRQANWG